MPPSASAHALLARQQEQKQGTPAAPVPVGLLVPWANQVVEAELPALSAGRVVWHTARLVPATQGTRLDDGFLAGLAAAIPAGLQQLSQLPLAAVCVACTSLGFTHPTQVQAEVEATGGRIFSAFDALLLVLGELQALRVLLCTPYPQPVADREVAALHAHGIQVVGQASLGLDDGYARVIPTQIHRLVEAAASSRAGKPAALVLSCTGWPTLPLLGELEERLGLPVVSSNLALAIAVETLARSPRQAVQA